MSRFFMAAGGISDEEDIEESEEEEVAKTRVGETVRPTMDLTSSESEEEKRVVRSAKDKRADELRVILRQLNNHKKIRDFSALLSDFEELLKVYDKGKKIDEGEVPKIYIKSLADLEQLMNEMWEDRESRDKLSKNNAKSLATLRQRVRKYNREFDTQIAEYKKNPEKYEEDEEAAKSEDEKEDEEAEPEPEEEEEKERVKPKRVSITPAPAKAPKAAPAEGGEEDEDDEDEWPEESEEESSTSEESDDEKYRENPAARFLKKAGADESDEEIQKDKTDREERKRLKKEREKKERLQREAEEDVAVQAADLVAPALKQEDIQDKQQRFQFLKEKLKLEIDKAADLKNELIIKKYEEVIKSQRGKRGTDRLVQIQLLSELQQLIADNLEVAPVTNALRVKLLFALVVALYDLHLNVLVSMAATTWDKVLKYVSLLLELLENNLDIDAGEQIPEDLESFIVPPLRVNGCILSICERLCDEYLKFLHSLDVHSNEYVERLRDGATLLGLLQRLVRYQETKFERFKTNTDPNAIRVVGHEEVARGYLKLMEQLYFKFDNKWAQQWDELQKAEREKKGIASDFDLDKCISEVAAEEPELRSPTIYQPYAAHFHEKSDAYKEMFRLYSFVLNPEYKFELKLRLRATLYFLYFLFIHDQYYEARDLFAMSQVASSIESIVSSIIQLGAPSVAHMPDIQLQILYNRVIVQMGMAAFRQGAVHEAHSSLVDVQSSGRAKELLGQGVQVVRGQQQEKTADQEKLERLKQLPYFMHINLDLLEAIYLIAATILEIPYMAAHEFDQKKKLISKNLHHVLKLQDRQLICSQPPETVRDHLIAAARALRVGDWSTTLKLIFADKMNVKIWDLFTPYAYQRLRLRELLVRRIKQEALKSYIFTYRYYYASISLRTLEQQFALPLRSINALIARMIIQDELNASLDQPTQTLVVHHHGASSAENKLGAGEGAAAEGIDSGGSERQRLQALVLQFNEKLHALFEQNEKLSELKNTQQTSAHRAIATIMNQQQGGPGGVAGVPSYLPAYYSGAKGQSDRQYRQQRGDRGDRGGGRDQQHPQGERPQRREQQQRE